MRALIGLLILGTLFIMAASWQDRTTSRLKSRRAVRYATPTDAVETGAGWSQLVLGRPSGAEPLPLPEPAPRALGAGPGDADPIAGGGDPAADWSDPAGQGGTEPPPGGPLAPTYRSDYRPDFEYVVRPQDSLGVICQNYYEERPALIKVVTAIAAYNELKTPNSIIAGDTILLPDIEVLFPPEGR